MNNTTKKNISSVKLKRKIRRTLRKVCKFLLTTVKATLRLCKKSVREFKILNSKERIRVVGIMILLLILSYTILTYMPLFLDVLILIPWTILYAIYNINPEFFDIFINFSRDISEAFYTLIISLF